MYCRSKATRLACNLIFDPERYFRKNLARGILGMVNYGPYDMAKEAVRALTRVAAREWGVDKITVNNVLPVAKTWSTDDIPVPTNALARHGSPEEDIAPVALFLASKDARFLTGYSLTPDGGLIIDSAR